MIRINNKISRIFLIFLCGLLLTACSSQHNKNQLNKTIGQQRQVLGPIETVELKEAGLSFVGRVDTGAKRTSIHAIDITVDENIVLEKGADVQGKPISFTVLTKEGKSKRVHTSIEKIVFVRTSEGGEYRYVVPLSFAWQGINKTVQVTLNDRSRMSFRLLLGRNWISKDFIVDVDK